MKRHAGNDIDEERATCLLRFMRPTYVPHASQEHPTVLIVVSWPSLTSFNRLQVKTFRPSLNPEATASVLVER